MPARLNSKGGKLSVYAIWYDSKLIKLRKFEHGFKESDLYDFSRNREFLPAVRCFPILPKWFLGTRNVIHSGIFSDSLLYVFEYFILLHQGEKIEIWYFAVDWKGFAYSK